MAASASVLEEEEEAGLVGVGFASSPRRQFKCECAAKGQMKGEGRPSLKEEKQIQQCGPKWPPFSRLIML